MIPPEELILLDTNVLIHLLRGEHAGKEIDSRYQLRSRRIVPLISIVNIGEILALAVKWNWSDQRQARIRALATEFTVVDISNEAVLQTYARLGPYWEKVGKRMEQNDLWIAATASAAGAWLLTTDRDFEKLHPEQVRVEWVNPEGLRRASKP